MIGPVLEKEFINNVFNKTFFDEQEDLNQLKGMYSKLSKRVLEIFDKSTKKNIVFKLLNDETIRGLINEQEMNVFKVYLSRLPMINSWDRISVMKYVCDYIYSNLYENMNDFVME